jgi:hypothetical protein
MVKPYPCSSGRNSNEPSKSVAFCKMILSGSGSLKWPFYIPLFLFLCFLCYRLSVLRGIAGCVTPLYVPNLERHISSKLIAQGLLAIQLHYQLFLDIFRNAFSFRVSNERTLFFSFIPVEPVEFRALATDLAGNRTVITALWVSNRSCLLVLTGKKECLQ